MFPSEAAERFLWSGIPLSPGNEIAALFSRSLNSANARSEQNPDSDNNYISDGSARRATSRDAAHDSFEKITFIIDNIVGSAFPSVAVFRQILLNSRALSLTSQTYA